ncbi:ArsR/SmtB family transcription factor [Sphingomicrobium clamense]|uniref:Metalloregulator ArsR/SmtB family transcription factor n=1 Tax=Sphingomicrobium clamense TaxID=2851013 RepID=A0ABS6V4G8_9SPHN|nr:metalloregulator ArsR/SmtB family transcription factor [Sphingomicrobium sp. B8]MBW0144448.1 metalloregulator ArsR/SmtB family transcription factor [Sphingomicrobium sp. B8]
MSKKAGLSATFHALSDISRLRILMLVRSMELTVGEVAQVLGQSQPRVSRHVRILDDAGLVRRRKEGSWTFIEATGSAPLDAFFYEQASSDDVEIFTADMGRLQSIRAERADAASRWFDSRTERFERLRALHAPEREVEDAVVATLGKTLGTLVDIGTGTGRMIELLAARADKVIGIDRSPDMLRLARVRIDEAGVGNAQLRQGDMTALPLKDGSADTVILHLVLHYAHSPSAALQEAARLLRPGGRLLIVDFTAHDREELRRDHGHQRLGFSDERVTDYCTAAGLSLQDMHTIEGDPLSIRLWTAKAPGRARTRKKEAA